MSGHLLLRALVLCSRNWIWNLNRPLPELEHNNFDNRCSFFATYSHLAAMLSLVFFSFIFLVPLDGRKLEEAEEVNVLKKFQGWSNCNELFRKVTQKRKELEKVSKSHQGSVKVGKNAKNFDKLKITIFLNFFFVEIYVCTFCHTFIFYLR